MAGKENEYAIGVLDSGVGGLTVVRQILKQLPKETICYFGDTLRCPYGPRKKSEVIKFTLEIVGYLVRFNLKVLVIACNTATAFALEEVTRRFAIPVLGVIEPGAKAAVLKTKNNTIGVIGTQGTILSGIYEKQINSLNPLVKVYSLACPNLAPLVERGLSHTKLAYKVVSNYLTYFDDLNIDTLILGCTHYPLLINNIKKVLPDVNIINSAFETVTKLKTLLEEKGMLATYVKKHRFFTTGSSYLFENIAKSWLKKDIKVERVRL